jgi:hypothetical protein
MVERKKINPKKAGELLEQLDKLPGPILSARQFIIMNFDVLRQSGKSLKELHRFFLINGVDVGTYASFQAVYNRVKRTRNSTSRGSVLSKP